MFNTPFVQTLDGSKIFRNKIQVDVLRLDQIHPIVSGNKWYKLQYYLAEAKKKKFTTIATFGGAYSNHIVATAFAAKQKGLKAIGIIRGEKPTTLSHTLQNAIKYGMQLHFVSRSAYQDKKKLVFISPDAYWIEEGGYGILGAEGIENIFDNIEIEKYTHFITAIGTGTTIAGIIKSIQPTQKAIGISVMKNNLSLHGQIEALLSDDEKAKHFDILHNYHFGGYAKKTNELIQFMNNVYSNVNLPLDFVYTAKAFYALNSLINNNTITSESSILFIHTGGLQGNLSLPQGTLLYK